MFWIDPITSNMSNELLINPLCMSQLQHSDWLSLNHVSYFDNIMVLLLSISVSLTLSLNVWLEYLNIWMSKSILTFEELKRKIREREEKVERKREKEESYTYNHTHSRCNFVTSLLFKHWWNISIYSSSSGCWSVCVWRCV